MLGLAALCFAGLLAGCAAEQKEEHTTLYVFGTLVEIVIRGESADKAQAAFAEIAADFRRYHRDWHAWKPGALTHLNAAFAKGQKEVVSAELRHLIRQAKEFSENSEGLFNPAIGKLIGAWGFHSDDLPQGPPPDKALIARLVAARPSMADVHIEGEQVWSDNPAVQLDFGGFAKGAALDLAEAKLTAMGIGNAILNAGGGVQVLGRHGARPWRVGIRHPLAWGVIASAQLAPGEALHTSGNYERYRAYQGVRFSHLIDPRTGWPVKRIVSASVIAPSGALADAAATALAVAGPEAWYGIAKRMGIKFALLVDAEGNIYLNPAMRARLRFEGAPPTRVTVSPRL